MLNPQKFPARVALLIFLLINGAFFVFAQKPIRDLQPTVFLISLDGFRPDYLRRYPSPTLNKLAQEGVQAEGLIPSYPSKTFPNHYTIATGLYPDEHGIIENNMYDATIGAEFHTSEREQVANPAWWGGEPIWVTAQKQGQLAASYFYPGTEAAIEGILPAFYRVYDKEVQNKTRIDGLLAELDLPVEKRPTMFTLYFSDTDDAGHDYSPDSPQIQAAVTKVDGEIKYLMDNLRQRKIDKKINLIILSDHGMATIHPREAIILDKMFDVNDTERIFWSGEFVQIFPKPGKEDEIYQTIKAKLPAYAHIYRPADFPAKYHFGKNPRIAPLVVVPDVGYTVRPQKDYDKYIADGKLDQPRGAHGYDNSAEAMRALFIAHGRAFRRHYQIGTFSNVEIYNLMCRVLNLKPAPNEGNLDHVKKMLRRN